MGAPIVGRVEGRSVRTRRAPWPPLRETWWVFGLAAVVTAVFTVAFVVRALCAFGHCAPRAVRLWMGIDALWAVPRLSIVVLFVSTFGFCLLALPQCPARTHRRWWAAVAGLAFLLALAKLTSVHSAVESVSPVGTLVGGSVIAVVVLWTLLRWGERCGTNAVRPVVLAFALYAAAALGLDAVSGVMTGLPGQIGTIAAVFVEELGEAWTALVLLVTVRWMVPSAASKDTPDRELEAYAR